MDSPLRATYLLSTFDYFVFSTLSPPSLLYSDLLLFTVIHTLYFTVVGLDRVEFPEISVTGMLSLPCTFGFSTSV
jgi:hypothetical protein